MALVVHHSDGKLVAMSYTRKTETYQPRIERDVPVPDREQEEIVVPRRMPEGTLEQLAKKMKPGESVLIPAGSKGKFKRLVELQGFTTTSRIYSKIEEARVWIIKPD